MHPTSQLHSLASAHYLLGRQSFIKKYWQRMMQSAAGLRPGMRTTTWICSGVVTPPVIDWQSPPD